MKIQLKYNDGTQRTIGSVSDITTCLDLDLGAGWVEQDGLIWTAVNAEAHPDDDGVYASAEILVDGIRTSLESVPENDIEAAFALISPEAIGTGRNADGNPDGSDDWDHPSAAAARQITADLGMEWDFTTWADAKILAHKSTAE
jgi:hypothetical protein